MGYYDNDFYAQGDYLRFDDEDIRERSLALKMHKEKRYRIELVKSTSKDGSENIDEKVASADTFDEAMKLAWNIFLKHIEDNENELLPCLDSERKYITRTRTNWLGETKTDYINISKDNLKEIRIMDDAGNDEFHINVRRWIDTYIMLKLMGVAVKEDEPQDAPKAPKRKATRKTSDE